MSKKPVAGGLILIFLISSLIPMVSSYESEENRTIYVDDSGGTDCIRINGTTVNPDHPMIEEVLTEGEGAYTIKNDGSNFSFHGVTSGENANWYVLKFQTSTQVKINELTVKYTYRSEDYPGVDWWGYAITNLTWTRWHAYTLEYLNESERFFHFQSGPFNFTYNHLDTLNNKNHSCTANWRDFGNPAGTWYLICYDGPSVQSKIEVYFNITGNVEFLSTTEGNSTTVLLPEDFLGNANVKIGTKLVGVLNGKKTINVNHTFLCLHYSFSSWGFERLRYTSPSGMSGNLNCFFWDKSRYRLPDTLDYIVGEAGTWHFTLDALLVGGIFNNWPPAYGISLLYADIMLP